jgi:hypothetical protein
MSKTKTYNHCLAEKYVADIVPKKNLGGRGAELSNPKLILTNKQKELLINALTLSFNRADKTSKKTGTPIIDANVNELDKIYAIQMLLKAINTQGGNLRKALQIEGDVYFRHKNVVIGVNRYTYGRLAYLAADILYGLYSNPLKKLDLDKKIKKSCRPVW